MLFFLNSNDVTFKTMSIEKVVKFFFTGTLFLIGQNCCIQLIFVGQSGDHLQFYKS